MSKSGVLNRSFSTREKVLLLILAIIILGAVYFMVIVKGTSETIQANTTETAEVEAKVKLGNTLLSQRQAMKKELDKLGSTASLPVIGTYDNLTAEVDELNSILSGVESYDISYSAPRVSDTTVRRECTVKFTMADTSEVIDVVKKLQNGKWNCQVTDVTVSAAMNSDNSIKNVTGSMTITYYETTTGASTTEGLVQETEESSSSSSKHISAAEVSAAFLSGGSTSK